MSVDALVSGNLLGLKPAESVVGPTRLSPTGHGTNFTGSTGGMSSGRSSGAADSLGSGNGAGGGINGTTKNVELPNFPIDLGSGPPQPSSLPTTLLPLDTSLGALRPLDSSLGQLIPTSQPPLVADSLPTIDSNAAPVANPEPASVTLFVLGALGIAAARRQGRIRVRIAERTFKDQR